MYVCIYIYTHTHTHTSGGDAGTRRGTQGPAQLAKKHWGRPYIYICMFTPYIYIERERESERDIKLLRLEEAQLGSSQRRVSVSDVSSSTFDRSHPPFRPSPDSCFSTEPRAGPFSFPYRGDPASGGVIKRHRDKTDATVFLPNLGVAAFHRLFTSTTVIVHTNIPQTKIL